MAEINIENDLAQINQQIEQLVTQLNQIINGDSVEVMKSMPDGFVDLTVTSPPYDSLRSYQDLIDELATFQDFGIDIHYIAGNHDYWDFGYLSQTANIIFHKNSMTSLIFQKFP